MRQLAVLMGSAADYDLILKSVQTGCSRKWGTRITDLRVGDIVFLYLVRPYSQLLAKAKVLQRPQKGESGDYRYRVKIGNFQLLPTPLTIDDLSQRFPAWKALQRLQGSQFVPTAYTQKLWRLVHDKSSRVQILISNPDYGLRLIEQQARTGENRYWSAPKNTGPGDTVLFYIVAPQQKIVASGKALSRTRQTQKKWYEAKIGSVQMLEQPLTLRDLREQFPDWPWLSSVTMFSYVNTVRAKRLLQLVDQRQLASSSGRVNGHSGAGFSTDQEKNRKVQKAAERFVKGHYAKQGYTVTPMDPNNPGYDLQVVRNGRTLYIEVKGVSGNYPSFVITRTELKQARRKDWRLAIVTEALKPRRQLQIMTGDDFRTSYNCSPMSYKAVPTAPERQ